MSDVNYYQPHIIIDGERLPEGGPADELTPVADFKLKWGASDWYSDVDGTTLELTLLDPLGSFLNFGDLQKKRVTITRDPDSTKVFDGTIDEVSVEYGRMTDPRTGKPRTMWRYDITAYDHLGALARDRGRGPQFNSREGADGRLHWGPCTMAERKGNLDTRTAGRIQWVPTPIDEWDNEEVFYFWPVAAYERQQVVSVLTVLRQTARIAHPFARPHYNPITDRIQLIRPPDGDQGTLSNTGFGDWYIELGTPSNGHCIMLTEPWEAVGGISGTTTALEQATQVEYIMRYEDFQRDQDPPYYQMVEGGGEVMTAVNPEKVGTSQMTIRLESDLAWTFNFYPFHLGHPVWSLLDPIYGRISPSDVEYRFDKHSPAPDGYEAFLSPHPTIDPFYTDMPRYQTYYFTPSILNTLPDTGPISFVGGELSYSSKRGWRTLMHPAPAPQPSTIITLGDTIAEAEIGWVNDESIIADWQHITREPRH